MKIEMVSVDDLEFDSENAREHPPENQAILRSSLEKFGQRKPIVVTHDNVVVAGNGTLLAALDLGWSEIAIVRAPEDWSHDMIRAFAIADNRSGDLSTFNTDILKTQLQELELAEFDLGVLGFDEKSLQQLGQVSSPEDLARVSGTGDDHSYTSKITVPHYDIVGDKPHLSELVDTSRTDELLRQIESADIPEDVAEFLRLGAMRHLVFNYRKIAEYYPHASKEVQRLMEESVLVIVDFEDAIRLGFVNFAETIEDLIDEE